MAFKSSVEAVCSNSDLRVMPQDQHDYLTEQTVTRHDAFPRTLASTLKNRFTKADEVLQASCSSSSHASGTEELVAGVSRHEWVMASRAVRTTSWGAVFYLLTTDVVGPFSTPRAFAQMGYGPGAALYTVFGALAGYSGWITWKCFVGLDSDRYPVTIGDLYLRVFGPWSRIVVNLMLAFSMLLALAILILNNGQSISQISQGLHGSRGNCVCFVACLVIFTAAGFFVGQIRSLHRLAWIANFSICINLAIIFLFMGVAAYYPPNFRATQASFGPDFGPGPVKTFAGTPPSGFASGGEGFIASINGLNQVVWAYGGCMTFTTFMAEMRRPMDFWKALLCGQLFIYTIYMVFGIFVYSFQGQYTFNPVMQELSPYSFQTATNIMNLVGGLNTATLYGNLGLKIFYAQTLQSVFHFPSLSDKVGKIAWAVTTPIWWALAFAFAASIPQFSYVTGLVSAFFVVATTYTLPALLAVGYWIKREARMPQEKLDTVTGVYAYHDHGFERWKRGFSARPFFIVSNVYFLGSLVTMVLGVYASVEGLISAFSGKSVATSFGCATLI